MFVGQKSPSLKLRRAMAEGTGFEPVKEFPPRVFETRAIGHYANPPFKSEIRSTKS